jgi:RNA polymerase sigma-70 factor (ECF subfamily)
LHALDKRGRFERVVLPHLDAAFNLARWLTHNQHDAEDVVQDACVRAFTSFDHFRGDDARAWLLTVVRNTCYTWLEKHRKHGGPVSLDETLHPATAALDPAQMLVRQSRDEEVRAVVAELPLEFREVVVLRELEGLSYKEIAAVLSIPLGTVMSRLTRARARLLQSLSARKEFSP